MNIYLHALMPDTWYTHRVPHNALGCLIWHFISGYERRDGSLMEESLVPYLEIKGHLTGIKISITKIKWFHLYYENRYTRKDGFCIETGPSFMHYHISETFIKSKNRWFKWAGPWSIELWRCNMIWLYVISYIISIIYHNIRCNMAWHGMAWQCMASNIRITYQSM